MGNHPMKPNPMFNRLEDLRLTFMHLRTQVLDQVENEDTAADLCDVIDYCLTKMTRCMDSIRVEAGS